jgi:hypothetical protein
MIGAVAEAKPDAGRRNYYRMSGTGERDIICTRAGGRPADCGISLQNDGYRDGFGPNEEDGNSCLLEGDSASCSMTGDYLLDSVIDRLAIQHGREPG